MMSKRHRDPVKTRAHILNIAFLEIFKKGFQGVSINEIIEKTEVTKGAFFHHFPTKRDLGFALADEVIRELMLSRWIRPLAAYKNPVQGILKELKKIIDTTPDEFLALGCPLNNLSQEMSSVDSDFHEKLLGVTLLWMDEIEKALKRAQTEGYLKRDADPRRLAEFIVTLHEGLFAMGKNFRDKKIWYSLYDSLKNHLEAQMP